MAKSSPKKSRKGRAGKRTRFPMSRRMENVFASVGITILALAIVASLAFLVPKLWKMSQAQKTRARIEALQKEDQWRDLRASGVVIRLDKSREGLFVDSSRWTVMPYTYQEKACALAAERMKSSRCFIYDAGTLAEVGWYTSYGGYKQKPPAQAPAKS